MSCPSFLRLAEFFCTSNRITFVQDRIERKSSNTVEYKQPGILLFHHLWVPANLRTDLGAAA